MNFKNTFNNINDTFLQKIKVLALKINWTKTISVMTLSLTTAFALILTFIAMPNTEQILPDYHYNLKLKEPSYWKKTFILETESTNKEKVKKTVDLIEKRLKKIKIVSYQVETEINYLKSTEESQDENNSNENNENPDFQKQDEAKLISRIKVTVQSNKDENIIKSLITSTGDVILMTPKPEVNFYDQENPYAAYIKDNYKKTDLNKSKFRSILIKKLPTDSNTESYFTVFKPKFGKETKEFNEFLEKNTNKQIGVEMNGFVRPYTIQNTNDPITINITNDKTEAKMFSILLNTESLPLEDITPTETNDKKVDLIQIPYKESLIGFVIGIFIISGILYYITKNQEDKFNISINYLATTALTLISWLTYLKINYIAVNLWMVLATGIFTALISALLSTEKLEYIYKYAILLIIYLIIYISTFFGNSYVLDFYKISLIIIPITIISNLAVKLYIQYFEKYILKKSLT